MLGVALWFAREYARTAPSEDSVLSSVLRAGEPAYIPLLLLAVAMLVSGWRPRPLLAASAAAIAAPLAAFCWSHEPFPLRSADIRPPALEALVAPHAGEVLWLNEKLAPWVWLGRANWASHVQGSGVVFSRALALAWRERMGFLRDLGWVTDGALTPRPGDGVDFPPFTRASLERLCGRADAPAFVVGAVESPDALAPGLEARFWRGPTRFSLHLSGAAPQWTPIEHYAIFDCAAYRPADRRFQPNWTRVRRLKHGKLSARSGRSFGDRRLKGQARVPGEINPGVLRDFGDESVDHRPALRLGVDRREMRLRQQRAHHLRGRAGVDEIVDDQHLLARAREDRLGETASARRPRRAASPPGSWRRRSCR